MRLSRRNFLRSGSLGALTALPLLSGMRRVAHAQTAPTRVLFVISRNGVWSENYWTDGVGETRVDEGKWSPIGRSRVFGSAFDGVRDKLSLVRGLDGLYNAAHNRCAPLCASTTPGSVYSAPPFAWSADTILGAARSVYGDLEPASRVLRLSLSPSPRAYENSWSWRTEGGTAVHLPVLGFEAAYASLMGEFPSGAMPPMPDPDAPTPEPPTNYVRQALARVEERYRTLGASRRIGAVDRERLQTHLESLISAGRRFDRPAPPPPSAMSGCGMPGATSVASIEDRVDSTIELLSASLACDLTRVAVLDFCNASDVGPDDSQWHEESHYPEVAEHGPDGLFPYTDYVGQRVARLLARLDSTSDVDGRTVLDNTLVVWVNEIAWGNSHDTVSMPIMLGGGTDLIHQGRQYDFTRAGEPVTERLTPRQRGLPYNRFLSTLFEAMSVPASDYERAGSGRGFGQWDDPDGLYGSYLGNRRATLPILV